MKLLTEIPKKCFLREHRKNNPRRRSLKRPSRDGFKSLWIINFAEKLRVKPRESRTDRERSWILRWTNLRALRRNRSGSSKFESVCINTPRKIYRRINTSSCITSQSNIRLHNVGGGRHEVLQLHSTASVWMGWKQLGGANDKFIKRCRYENGRWV